MATTNWSADHLYTLSIAEIFILPPDLSDSSIVLKMENDWLHQT